MAIARFEIEEGAAVMCGRNQQVSHLGTAKFFCFAGPVSNVNLDLY